MNLRPAAGVVAGTFIWWFLFMFVGTAFGMLWPDYRAAARHMFETGTFTLFTTPMLCLNLLLFLVIGVATGWLVTAIARNRIAAQVLALIALAYMGFNHLYRVWGMLPDWYNVIVPFVIAASMVLGGRLPRRAPSAA
jgi:hypothetical protein